jgi:hypothetical protein
VVDDGEHMWRLTEVVLGASSSCSRPAISSGVGRSQAFLRLKI